MSPDDVKQIVETIKTLNINLNEPTTQEIAKQIIPVFKMWIYYQIFGKILFYGFIVFLARGIYKLINNKKVIL